MVKLEISQSRTQSDILTVAELLFSYCDMDFNQFYGL